MTRNWLPAGAASGIGLHCCSLASGGSASTAYALDPSYSVYQAYLSFYDPLLAPVGCDTPVVYFMSHVAMQIKDSLPMDLTAGVSIGFMVVPQGIVSASHPSLGQDMGHLGVTLYARTQMTRVTHAPLIA